jgi:hypothetical protein
VDIPGIRHYRTADEFFADGEIDLVVVATHHDTHAMFAERALEMGMHGLLNFLFFFFFFFFLQICLGMGAWVVSLTWLEYSYRRQTLRALL